MFCISNRKQLLPFLLVVTPVSIFFEEHWLYYIGQLNSCTVRNKECTTFLTQNQGCKRNNHYFCTFN